MLDESEGVLDITYRSLLKEYTVMHIHGVNPQQNSDGEDGFPLQARWMIAPGASKRVQYALGQSGTFFMHSHFNMQQEQGLILPLVIREGSPPAGYPLPTLHAAQEALMVLEERCPYPAADPAPPHCLDGSWSQSALQAKVLASMRADWDDISDTVAAADHEAQCVAPANDTDVYFLHSLVNGQASSHLTLPAAGGGGGEGGDQGEGGEQGQDLVRVRIINAGAMSSFKVLLPEGSRIIKADGAWVVPMRRESLWVGVGQRYALCLPHTLARAVCCRVRYICMYTYYTHTYRHMCVHTYIYRRESLWVCASICRYINIYQLQVRGGGRQCGVLPSCGGGGVVFAPARPAPGRVVERPPRKRHERVVARGAGGDEAAHDDAGGGGGAQLRRVVLGGGARQGARRHQVPRVAPGGGHVRGHGGSPAAKTSPAASRANTGQSSTSTP